MLGAYVSGRDISAVSAVCGSLCHSCQDFLVQTEARFVRDSSTGRVASSLVYVRTEISNADLVLLGMFV